MTDTSVLVGETDAAKWAATFVAVVRERPGIEHDMAAMTTWFTGAIMAGYDWRGRIQAQRRPLPARVIHAIRAEVRRWRNPVRNQT